MGFPGAGKWNADYREYQMPDELIRALATTDYQSYSHKEANDYWLALGTAPAGAHFVRPPAGHSVSDILDAYKTSRWMNANRSKWHYMFQAEGIYMAMPDLVEIDLRAFVDPGVA